MQRRFDYARNLGGYARQIELAIDRIQDAAKGLHELALGGTAGGAGINTPPQFAPEANEIISAETGLPFREAENYFEAQAARDACVHLSGALRNFAVSLINNQRPTLSCVRTALRDRRDRPTGHTVRVRR